MIISFFEISPHAVAQWFLWVFKFNRQDIDSMAPGIPATRREFCFFPASSASISTADFLEYHLPFAIVCINTPFSLPTILTSSVLISPSL
ncbi:hypothetical protein L2E82_26454 [Cichorium intybus]|uniref:Uncharacterized protein n=1 Tax=Cichorium intybus TaxID=13427 RepID=A0ACB9CQS0_CICIN|nr:hypothetical protein L2E82_26454 [Cichorium intybus]